MAYPYRDEREARVLSAHFGDPEARTLLAAKNPQKRLVTPAEVASAVAWLCRPENASINGHALPIDGGEVVS